MDFSGDYVQTVGGRSVGSSTRFDVFNPATGEVLAQAPQATTSDLNAAVEAASQAFAGWSKTPIDERRAVLNAIAQRIAENATQFSRLLTQEQGKPREQADFEVGATSFWCSETAKLDLPVTKVELEDRSSITTRVPLGVVGAITPWNFPLLLAMWKIAPALLAGNTLVLKPSPFTPLGTLKMFELIADLLPAGVVNCVAGGGEIGEAMTRHPAISKISFTGSTETGRKIMASSASTLKRITLELGGNDAAIVLPNVDVPRIANDLFWGAFANSGQVCVASKRVYVHESIYDDVRDKLVDIAKSVKVGDGLEQGTQLGPIQNRMQFDKVQNLLEDCHARKLNFLTGGEKIEGNGYFAPITIVDNPPEDSRVVTEEAFGPVLPILKYASVDEAVERANNSPLGLGGSVWSDDETEAHRVADQITTGNVWINQNITFHPAIPYATAKQSGIGVEHAAEGLVAFTNAKTVITARRQ